jgi:hypothetical protein
MKDISKPTPQEFMMYATGCTKERLRLGYLKLKR